MHITGGIDRNQCCNDHNNEKHHCCQWIDEEAELDGEITNSEPFDTILDRIVHGSSAAKNFDADATGDDQIDDKYTDNDTHRQVFTASGKKSGNRKSKERQ